MAFTTPIPNLPGSVANGQAVEIYDRSVGVVDGYQQAANTAFGDLDNAGALEFGEYDSVIWLPIEWADEPIAFDQAMEFYTAMIALLPPGPEIEPSDIPEPVESITMPSVGSAPSAPVDPNLTPPELRSFVTPPPVVSVTAPTLVPIDTSLSEPDYTLPVIGTFGVLPPEEPTYAVPDDVSNIEALLDLAVTKLTEDMTDGTYGIDNNQETLLWERSKERERVEYQAAIDEVDTFASFGFSRPPGSMNKALEKAQQNYYAKLASLNREQTIKRADMHFEARKNAVAAAIQLKGLIEDVNKVLAQIYQTRVQAYIGRMEAYKTEESLKLERYKSELSGFETKVKAFLGRVEAVKSNESNKIESFKAQLSMYETREKIYLGQIEAFKTEETLRVENFKSLLGMWDTQQKIYMSKIEAFKVQSQIAIERMKGDIDAYDAKVKAYLGKTEVYKTEQTVKIEEYKAQIQAFEAQLKGLGEVFKMSQEAKAEEYRAYLGALQYNVEKAKLIITAKSKKADMIMEGAKAKADVYKALIASALSMLHVTATTSAGVTSHTASNVGSSVSNSYSENYQGTI